jgi:hypothetical protein
MSRLLKLIASICVLAAGGAVALAAGSAPAQTRSHMIICPLEPNDTITQPCCGPPIVTAASSAVIPCCGTPLPINCPSGLTLSSSADPSVAGQKITLTGRWPGGTAGQTVDLFQELPGAKRFTKVAAAKTGSLGDFKFVRKGVETNRKWYVAVGSERSLTVDQRVKAVVTLKPGRRPNDFHGRVTPKHPAEEMSVERQKGPRWVVIARPRLSPNSTYAFKAKLCNSTVRVLFPGDQRNVRGGIEVRSSCDSVGSGIGPY